MTADMTDKKATAPRPAWLRISTTVLRLALIGCVSWACWWAAATWAALLGWWDEQPVALQKSEQQYLGSALDAMALAPAGGAWSFPGLDWQLGMRELGEDKLVEALEQHPGDIPLAANRSDTEKDWIDIVKQAMKPHKTSKDELIYRLDQPGMKGIAFLRVEGGVERLVAGRLAMHRPQGKWQLIELRPGKYAATFTNTATAFIPLPDGASLLCSRSDHRGRPLCDVVKAPMKIEGLRKHWQRAGWKVRQVFADDKGSINLLCIRGERVVNVWTGPVGEVEDGTVLLLFRGTKE